MEEGIKVEPAWIEQSIRSEHYFTAAHGLVGREAFIAAGEWQAGESRPVRLVDVPNELELITFCVLVLRNGFTVVGKSACADPKIFDEQLGREFARKDAFAQCWNLLGFLLREQMARGESLHQPVESCLGG